MNPRVKLFSVIAGAALLVSVLLIAATQIRRARPPGPPDVEDTAVGPDQGSPGFGGQGPIPAGEKAAPFKLTDLSGESGSMACLRGYAGFRNISAPSCAPL